MVARKNRPITISNKPPRVSTQQMTGIMDIIE
jgi:hypothetical protein